MGKPIIAYSIEAALQSGLFDEVMVSTDDEEIAAMLAPFRGEVKPFSPTFIPKLSGQPETREQTNTGQPGFWHRALNFWSGLRQREKKTIAAKKTPHYEEFFMAKYFSRLFRLFSCCFGSGFCGSLLRGSDFAGRSFAVAFFCRRSRFQQ